MQARHHFKPIVVLVQIILGIVRSSPMPQQEAGAQRNIEIGRRRGIDAEESRRRDSCHGEWNVIDQMDCPGALAASPKRL
jgi:hypothetical protein